MQTKGLWVRRVLFQKKNGAVFSVLILTEKAGLAVAGPALFVLAVMFFQALKVIPSQIRRASMMQFSYAKVVLNLARPILLQAPDHVRFLPWIYHTIGQGIR